MHFLNRISAVCQDCRGAISIELSLILPALLLATLMVFDVGRAVLAYSSLNDVAADAARYASIHGARSGGSMSDDEIISYAKSRIAGLELSAVQMTVTWQPSRHRGSSVSIDISSEFTFLATRLLPMSPINLDGHGSMTVL